MPDIPQQQVFSGLGDRHEGGVLSGMTPEGLAGLMVSLGEKAYRGRQVFTAIHANQAQDIESVTTLSKQLRIKLAELGFRCHSLAESANRLSSDGTRKIAFVTIDGLAVETVLIPMEGGTYTQCVSSQAGCALGCTFCMTGHMGFHRNLTPAEIVDQHLMALPYTNSNPVRNIVFMGMGEPLLNFDSVKRAVLLLNHESGRGIGLRRITISTAGVIPGIRRLANELPVLLAVSLNAPDQALRERIMPITRTYPLVDLLEVLRNFPLAPRQRLTFEYVLLRDVNDSVDHAKALLRLVSHIKCKINLIAYNPHDGSTFDRPCEDRVMAFYKYIYDKKVTVTLRKSKGADIEAACGQLAGGLVSGDELDDDSDEQPAPL